MVGGGVRIEKNDLPELAKQFGRTVIDSAAREIAFECLKRAQEYLSQQVYTRPNVQVTAEKMDTVPEPTGALWNSGYVRTFTGEVPPGCPTEESAYPESLARRPDSSWGTAPPEPDRPGFAQVVFGMEYARAIEFGNNKNLIARPYIRPAAADIQNVVERFIMAKLRMAGFR